HKKNDIGWIFNSKSDFSSYSKGDVFLEFAKYAPIHRVFEGETTLTGNAFGYNKNIDESISKEFKKFMDNISITNNSLWVLTEGHWNGQDEDIWILQYNFSSLQRASPYLQDKSLIKEASDLFDEYMEKLSSPDLSFSEFKKRYVEFRKKYDEFTARMNPAIKEAWKKMGEFEDRKPFEPIQGESDNTETYQDEFRKTFFERFLKVEQEKGNDITEILEQLSKIGYKFSG
ncbi:hypothetical protein CCZ01_09855, partial [Helicobacter monodelphidis]